MKRIALLMIFLFLSFSIVGCGSNNNAPQQPTAEPEQQEEQQPEETPETVDLSDKLVKVTLTPENFEEYFEFVKADELDAFGDKKEGMCEFGVKSKMFEDGYYIYNGKDLKNLNLKLKMHSPLTPNPYEPDADLFSLLGFSWSMRYDDFDSYEVTKVTDNEIQFISKEYVANVEQVGENPNNPNWKQYTITFVDGTAYTAFYYDNIEW